MSEGEFWRFVWLVAVRLPFATMPPLMAFRMGLWGAAVLIVARYTGIRIDK